MHTTVYTFSYFENYVHMSTWILHYKCCYIVTLYAHHFKTQKHTGGLFSLKRLMFLTCATFSETLCFMFCTPGRKILFVFWLIPSRAFNFSASVKSTWLSWRVFVRNFVNSESLDAWFNWFDFTWLPTTEKRIKRSV